MTLSAFPPQINGGLGRLGASAGAPVVVSNVIFFDTFTGTNGTLLINHTPDIDVVGGGWKNINLATAQIIGNKAGVSVGGDPGAGIESSDSDVIITADWTQGSTGRGYIVFRSSAFNILSTFWVELIAASSEITLRERVGGGGLVARASAVVSTTINQTYPMTVTLSGQSITCSVVGNLGPVTLSYSTTTHQSNTIHGFLLRSSDQFDDFRIEAA